MKDSLIQVPASHYEYKGQLADGAHKVVLYTLELTDAQALEVLKKSRTPGWFVFKENDQLREEDLLDVPEENVDVAAGQKSDSQRLRNVMYVYWETNTSKRIPFDIWRHTQMEKIIENWKSKLPERD